MVTSTKMTGNGFQMTVYCGGKKREMANRLVCLVGKSVNSESENRVGGRKWESFLVL
jgi:hypothetical protein